MRRVFASLTLLACLLMASVSPAADEKNKDPKDTKPRKLDLSKVAEAGPGVYDIKFDAKGRIVSMLVVGSSIIRTSLGAAKGKEIARQRASMKADAEFVKFLKTEASVRESTDDETLVFLAGKEGDDKEAKEENSKSIEKTSAKMETVAKGLVRGMQVVHVEVQSKERMYYLVKKWKAKTAAGVKDVEADLKEDAKKPAPKETGGEKPGERETKTPPKKKPDDKKIVDKKITIDDDD